MNRSGKGCLLPVPATAGGRPRGGRGSSGRCPGQFLEGQDPPDSPRRDVPRTVPQPLPVASEPGPGDVDFQDHGAFDPAAVPLDDVKDGPPAAGRRASPNRSQLALAVGAEQAKPENGVQTSSAAKAGPCCLVPAPGMIQAGRWPFPMVGATVMQIASIDLRINQGTLALTDEGGTSARYHRVDSPFDTSTVHLVCDRVGCQAMAALLQADSFPKELIVKHQSPQQPSRWPDGAGATSPSEFRYVLDED